jgi:hypothetical protein
VRTHLFYPPDLVGIHWPLGLCAFRRTGVDCAKERVDTVMKTPQNMDEPHNRMAPIEMSADEFRAAGHDLIDTLADFPTSLPERPVAPGETPAEVRRVLGNASLPGEGTSPHPLLKETADLLHRDQPEITDGPRCFA